MKTIYDKILIKNKNQPISKAWLQETYKERTELDRLMRIGNKEAEINLLNQKFLTYPVHPVDWTYEELRDLWAYFENQEIISLKLDLLFKKQNPNFELQLKNAKNETESKELLKKKASFLQKKLAMKARFLANKTQSFRTILRKFMRKKKFFVGFRKGRIRFRRYSKLGKLYKRLNTFYWNYRDDHLANRYYNRAWWFTSAYKRAGRKLYVKKKKIEIARLHIRKSFSNIFFTLTDKNDKVIYTVTTGMVTPVKNIKVSRSQDTLEKMVNSIRTKLKFIRIKNLQLIVKSKCKWHYNILKNQLKRYGIRIVSILERRIAAHNGVRRKNKPVK